MSLRKITPTTIKRKDFETGKLKTIKRFPRFEIGLRHLPEAKDWPVEGNKKYLIALELDMVGLDLREKKSEDGESTLDMEFQNRAEFIVTGLEILPHGSSHGSERVSRKVD